MIYTVTFNPAIDYVVRLDAPLEVGQVNRACGEDCVLGGKGINVSGVLAQLGCPSVALGFVAGETGAWLERGLAAQGLKTDFVHLENGMTRINVKIKAAQETELNGAGPDIPDEALHQLEEKLDSLAAKYDFITDRRGMGLMQGLVFDRPVAPVINAALENGLILINAGTNIIRFVPPLVITDADVDEMIEILDSCLKTFQEQNA